MEARFLVCVRDEGFRRAKNRFWKKLSFGPRGGEARSDVGGKDRTPCSSQRG